LVASWWSDYEEARKVSRNAASMGKTGSWNLFERAVVSGWLEHQEDDVSAVRDLSTCLRSGARVLVVVPAHELLYGQEDMRLKRFRRYGRSQLRTLLTRHGFQIARLQAFDFLGGWSWLLTARMRGRSPESSSLSLGVREALVHLEALGLPVPFGRYLAAEGIRAASDLAPVRRITAELAPIGMNG
jgi:hypothetical protein